MGFMHRKKTFQDVVRMAPWGQGYDAQLPGAKASIL